MRRKNRKLGEAQPEVPICGRKPRKGLKEVHSFVVRSLPFRKSLNFAELSLKEREREREKTCLIRKRHLKKQHMKSTTISLGCKYGPAVITMINLCGKVNLFVNMLSDVTISSYRENLVELS